MPDSESDGLCENLRRIRERLGMTQQELAVRSGVSQRTIEDLEQDPARNTTVDTLRRLAAGLGTTTSVLLHTRRESIAPDNSPRTHHLLGLRTVLGRTPYVPGMTISQGDDVPSLAAMRDALREAREGHRSDDYDTLVVCLPEMIAGGRLLVRACGGATEAASLLSGVLRFAGMTLRQMGFEDMAVAALSEAVEVATRSHAWVAGAYGVARLSDVYMCQGRFTEAADLCVGMADHLRGLAGPRPYEPRALELAAPRATVLTTAAAAAVRDGRDTDELLDEAEKAASPLDVRDESRVRVDAMRAEVATIQGRPDEALEHSRHVPWTTDVCEHPNMVRRNHLDIAAAHLVKGDIETATHTIVRVGTAAPMWLRRQPYGREIVEGTRAAFRRRLPEDLVRAADMVGLPL